MGFVILAGLGLLAGCGAPPPTNIVLITTDTTRADHLGSYGYGRPTSPVLDALAAESGRFEWAFSHAPITLPSHTSILSGTLPLFHGVRDNGRFVVPEKLTTLAEIVRDEGYATGAFVSAFVLDSRFGLDQGFQVYDDSYTDEWSEEKLRDARIYNQMVTDRPADQTTERAIQWLDGVEEPFFLWVHYYDPHQRYAPPHPYDQRFHDSLYDGEIAFMDAEIGRLLDAVKERFEWEQTAVVVTADHGEGLGQHGEATHAVLSYDSTLRVGLIVKAPKTTGIAPRVIEAPVSHVDILPTFLDFLGLDVPEEVSGRSLRSLLEGGSRPDRPIYFETVLPRFSFGWETLFGVRSKDWKYVHGPQRELYRLADDRGELYNRATTETDQRRDMEELLFALISSEQPAEPLASSQPSMDPEARQQLAALGYVGSGSSVSNDELNPRQPTGRLSPVTGLTYLSDYYLANGLSGRGQLAEAAQIYASTLLPLDPDNPSFLTNLANLERRLGRPEEAFDLFRRAQAVDPNDPEILLQLGQLESDRGNLEAAEQLFLSARQLDPSNLSAAYLAALTAARGGRSDDAIERFEEALVIDPSHLDSRLQLGIERAKDGEVDGARRELRTARGIAPFSPRIHYNLALLELRSGNPQVALGGFETALRFRQPYPAARLGFALALRELGREEEARKALEEVVSAVPSSPAARRAKLLLSEESNPVGGVKDPSLGTSP